MKRFVSIPMLLFLTACDLRVLDPASDTAERLTDLIYLSFGLMMMVFAVVILLFVRFLRKYRESPGQEGVIPKESKENKWLEASWTVLPILLLVVLAVPTVKATYELTAQVSGQEGTTMEAGRTINVEAERFKWTFTYENGKTSVNELVLPVNQKVNFKLTSKDVIHSFWIPNLAGKIDVLPGEINKQSFTPNEKGIFQGKCAEFCGAEHAWMRFETRVVSKSQFQNWLNKK